MDVAKSATPLVSVVMCVYNTLPYIKAATDSILNQTYDNWEFIIAEDAATDGTREWLKENLSDHPKVHLFFAEKNQGTVPTKNFAFKQAKGDFICVCDADDLYAPDLLEKQVSVTQQHPHIKLVACGYHQMTMDGKVYNTVAPPEDTVYERYPGKPYPFWFPPILIHRSVYEAMDAFVTYFVDLGEDLYWVAKANERFPVYCLKEAMYYYRDTPNAHTKVMNNPRKMIAPTVLEELLRQRATTGTDWLEQGDAKALEAYEASLFADKKFMAEKYRLWANKAVDVADWKQSERLLKKALAAAPFYPTTYRTAFYYLRKRAGLLK